MLVLRLLVAGTATVLLLRGGQAFSVRPIARSRRACSVDDSSTEVDDIASRESLYQKMFHNAFSKFLEAVLKCSEEYAEKRKLNHCEEDHDDRGKKRVHSGDSPDTSASHDHHSAANEGLPAHSKTSREGCKEDSLQLHAPHNDASIKSNALTKDKYSGVGKSYNEETEPMGQYSERQAAMQPAAANLVSSIVDRNASYPGSTAFEAITIGNYSLTDPVEILDIAQNELNNPVINDVLAKAPKEIEKDQVYDSAAEGQETISTTDNPVKENALFINEARDNFEIIPPAPSTIKENVQDFPANDESRESLPDQIEVVPGAIADPAQVAVEKLLDAEFFQNSPSEKVELRTAAKSMEENAEVTETATDVAGTTENKIEGTDETENNYSFAESKPAGFDPESVSLQLSDASGNSPDKDSILLATSKVEDTPEPTTNNPQDQLETDSSSTQIETRPYDEVAAPESNLELSESLEPQLQNAVFIESVGAENADADTEAPEPEITTVSEESDEVVPSNELATTDGNAVAASTIQEPATVEEGSPRSLTNKQPAGIESSSTNLSPNENEQSNEVVEKSIVTDRFGRESAAVIQEVDPDPSLALHPAESRNIFYSSDSSDSVLETPSTSSASGDSESLQPEGSLQVFNVDNALSNSPKIGCKCHFPKEFLDQLKQGIWKSLIVEIMPR